MRYTYHAKGGAVIGTIHNCDTIEAAHFWLKSLGVEYAYLRAARTFPPTPRMRRSL